MAHDDHERPTEPDLTKLCQYREILSGLVVIYATVQCQGVGNAARALGFKAPAAVSNWVRQMEKLLNIAIMEHRHSGTYKLTADGEKLKELAQEFIPKFQAFIVAHEAAHDGNELRIATITSVWGAEKHGILERFQAEGGRIVEEEVKHIDHTKKIIPLVRSRSVDIGIVTYPPKPVELGTSLQLQEWKSEDMVIVASAQNEKFSHAKHNILELFETCMAVMLRKTYGVRKAVDEYLEINGKKPRVAAERDKIAEIVEMVAHNSSYISILPILTVKNDRRLQHKRLTGMKPRPISFVYRNDCREIVKKFLACFPPKPDR